MIDAYAVRLAAEEKEECMKELRLLSEPAETRELRCARSLLRTSCLGPIG